MRAWPGAVAIETDPRLRTIAVILLLSSFASLAEWYRKPGLLAVGFDAFDSLPAWPLSAIGGGLPLDFFWSKALLYAVMTMALLAACGLLAGFDARLPMAVLAVVWPLDCYLYLSDLRLASNAQHLRLLLTAVFLVSGGQLRSFRLGLVAGLFLSAVARLNPSWVAMALPADIPGIARGLILPATLAMLLPLLLPVAWGAGRKDWMRIATVLTALGILAWSPIDGWLAPTLLVPSLWLAFLDEGVDAPSPPPTPWRDRAVWAILTLTTLGTLLPLTLPGDRRLTQEGAYSTLYPRDARRKVSARYDLSLHGRRLRLLILVNDFDDSGVASADCQVEEWRGRRLVRSGPLRGALMVNGMCLFNPAILQPVNPRVLADPYFHACVVNEIIARCAPDALHLTLGVMLNDDLPAHTVVDLDVSSPLSWSPWHHNEWIRLR